MGQDLEQDSFPAYDEKQIEVLPYLVDCEESMDQSKCSGKKLVEFIARNFKYPGISRENGKEGTLLLGFTVDTSGRLKNGQVLHGFDKAVKKEGALLLMRMQKELNWQPGKLNGKKVPVRYKLPIYLDVLKRSPRRLCKLEELLCERGKTYSQFELKKKKIKKVFSSSQNLNEYWYYQLWGKELTGMSIRIEDGGEVKEIPGFTEMTDTIMNELLSCKKGTLLTVTLTEESYGEVKEVVKSVEII